MCGARSRGGRDEVWTAAAEGHSSESGGLEGHCLAVSVALQLTAAIVRRIRRRDLTATGAGLNPAPRGGLWGRDSPQSRCHISLPEEDLNSVTGGTPVKDLKIFLFPECGGGERSKKQQDNSFWIKVCTKRISLLNKRTFNGQKECEIASLLVTGQLLQDM